MTALKAIMSMSLVTACLSAHALGRPFIGELTDMDSGICIKTSVSLENSLGAEEEVLPQGSPLTVNTFKTLDRGTDLIFRLSDRCFLDHITLEYSDSRPDLNVQVLSTDGKALSEEYGLDAGSNTIPIAVWNDSFVIRFRKRTDYLRGVSIEPLRKFFTSYTISDVRLFGATGIEDTVYPLPASLEFGDGVMAEFRDVSAGSECSFAARNFIEKYSSRFGGEKDLKLSRKGNVCFSIDRSFGEEAFSIKVTPKGADIRGGSPRALLYASEKLLQLCCPDGTIRCATIEDSPALALRGVHIGLPDRCNIDFLKRTVKYLLMPLGYNTVFLQLSGAMEYKKHPAINEAWLKAIDKWEKGEGPRPAHLGFIGTDIISQDEVRDLCSFLRQYGMEIVPEVQSFSHSQYVTMAYPELSEKADDENVEAVDLHKEDQRPSTVYYHTSCPNHKEYFNVFFDIIDEVISVVRPEKFVSIGHDEIYELGKCPLCREEGAVNVYVREVTALHDHIAEKGLRTALWSDMMDERKYPTYEAVDKLPKDIICMPFTWYFHLDSTDNIEDRTLSYGYDFILGNMYSSHYPRFVERSGMDKCLGGEVSTWCRFDELSLGYDGKIYDWLYASLMLWSHGYREDFRRTYTELANSRIDGIRENLHYGETARKMEETELVPDNFTSDNLPYDIRDEFGGAAIAGPGYDAIISIGRQADGIRICHATESPDDLMASRPEIPEPKPIGKYIMEYEDGTMSGEDIYYGANIGTYRWAYGAPMLSNLFRHYGYTCTYFASPVSFKTADGRDASLWNYTIDNPFPDKKIKSLRIMCENDRNTRIFVVGATALKKHQN